MAPLTPKEKKKKKKKKNIPPIPPIKRKINKKKKRVANRAYARARDKPSILKQTKKEKPLEDFFHIFAAVLRPIHICLVCPLIVASVEHLCNR